MAHGQVYEGFFVSALSPNADFSGALVFADQARALDAEAQAQWGLNPFALVEAAGRACAEVFSRWHGKKCLSVAVLTGKGNNAADSLVMLKALILNGFAVASDCSVFAAYSSNDNTPLSSIMLAVRKLGVQVLEWDRETAAAVFAKAGVVIDGIAGTGVSCPLRGAALEMAETVNAASRGKNSPLVVSIDVPSGNFNGWKPGMPIVQAHATLSIEPHKISLYAPAARPYSGTILPVGGIFPSALIEQYREAELIEWGISSARVLPVSKTAYKYERGVVEIRAGSSGAAGAAMLAARGAQSAGAGMVRLVVDNELYPVIASNCLGIMVAPDKLGMRNEELAACNHRSITPHSVLLGPGWGRGEDRMRILESYLPLEENGTPLILDADAIALAKGLVFHGNTIITPHPGEFAAYTGIPKDEILADPIPALRRFSVEKNIHILFKSHVLYIASPDCRLGVIDGMNPVLGAGGSGDVLAGFCASIAARWRSSAVCNEQPSFDGYACACAAASLLVRSAQGFSGAFVDPGEFAKAAAAVAGNAWLGGGTVYGR